MENLAHSEIGHLFDCSEGQMLTLAQALEERAVVYIVLQTLAFPAYAMTLGKLVINDWKHLLSTRFAHG